MLIYVLASLAAVIHADCPAVGAADERVSLLLTVQSREIYECDPVLLSVVVRSGVDRNLRLGSEQADGPGVGVFRLELRKSDEPWRRVTGLGEMAGRPGWGCGRLAPRETYMALDTLFVDSKQMPRTFFFREAGSYELRVRMTTIFGDLVSTPVTIGVLKRSAEELDLIASAFQKPRGLVDPAYALGNCRLKEAHRELPHKIKTGVIKTHIETLLMLDQFLNEKTISGEPCSWNEALARFKKQLDPVSYAHVLGVLGKECEVRKDWAALDLVVQQTKENTSAKSEWQYLLMNLIRSGEYGPQPQSE